MNDDRIKILLIEDDLADVDLFRELLSDVKRPHFDVKWADRLDLGIRHLTQKPSDVILLDLFLPDSEGVDTFTRLRNHAPSLPIVVLTGLNDEMTAFQTLQQGAQDYLVKGQVDGPMLSRVMRYAIERKRLEEALLNERSRTQRVKDLFVGTASHELRTPMTVIREGLRYIQSGALGEITEDQKRFLSLCMEGIDRLDHIADELLNISKIESGKAAISKERLEMVQLVKDVVFTFDALAKSKGLSLITRFPEEPVYITADKDKTIQVLTNLISNAIKFTQKGKIEISLTDKDDAVECHVSDTGRGIAKEDLPKVFERFQQFGPKTKDKGTGLGLSICKDLIELQGGKISVDSQPGKGTRFIFTLPK